MLYNVFDDVYRLNKEIDRVLRGGNFDQHRSFPPVNVYEDKDQYIVVARIPGVSKDELSLSTKENSLKISGERKKDEEQTYFLNERFKGEFERNFIFDERIDSSKVSAELKDGMLLVKLAKAEEGKAKVITVK